MPSNKLPNALPALVALGEDIADGLDARQDEVGVKQNRGPDVRAAVDNLRELDRTYNAERARKPAFTKATTDADNAAKAFITVARDVLKPRLGNDWSEAWVAAGFTNGTLSLPERADLRMEQVNRLGQYFVANPSHQVADLQATSVRAFAVHKALSDARSALHAQLNLIATTKSERDNTMEILRTTLRGTINELSQLMKDDDPRWLAFGLNPPAAAETPDVPDGLVVTAGAPGSGKVYVDWDDVPRAERYRVWRQLSGETEPVAVATVTESETTLANQPIGQLIKIIVTALNDAGESGRSAAQELSVV